MHKYPIELQDEEKSCGAYCIDMILKYYHFYDEIKNIKKKARLNQNGISIRGMIECLKSYQIEAKAYEATLEDIVREVKCPCILYMIYDGIGHFVAALLADGVTEIGNVYHIDRGYENIDHKLISLGAVITRRQVED